MTTKTLVLLKWNTGGRPKMLTCPMQGWVECDDQLTNDCPWRGLDITGFDGL